jgi:hypothetical protein
VGVWKTSSQESAGFHNSNFNPNSLLFYFYIGILFPMLSSPTPVLTLLSLDLALFEGSLLVYYIEYSHASDVSTTVIYWL